jgi:pimeloyl-ACP methyl ester carboxylesterase
MYYEIHGEGGIPLVLIHGGGSTIPSTFGNFLPLLKGKRIAMELQAHGRTRDRGTPESFEQDADDVAALLKYLKIGKANILGFSNGGTTTLQIAIRHPAIVHKIVVVSASYQREGMVPGLLDSMPQAALENMPAPLKESFLELTPDTDRLLAMFNQDKNRMINFKDIPDEALHAIGARAMIIAGDQDVVTAEHTVKMSKAIPGARLAILPGNHGSFIGEMCSVYAGSRLPEMTALLVEEFLMD